VETSCFDDCDTICEPVLEEQCWSECYEEPITVCEDQCQLWQESCAWVTHSYTTKPSLSDIVATQARIFLPDPNGLMHTIDGDEQIARQAQECTVSRSGQSQCVFLNEWSESDLFVEEN
jgi:hypothetical protein